MADLDDIREGSRFEVKENAQATTGIKGAQYTDWGVQNRLANIFDPSDNRTLMLAFDHGYFQGPTSGLEVLETNIPPLVPHADALMLTRGALRTTITPSTQKGKVLRASGGPSVLGELSDEHIVMDIQEAVRLNADALAVQVFVGGEHESRSIKNLSALVDAGSAAGIPILGVTAVGKDMARDARYFRLASRIPAELGASLIKTYYVEEGFETITASCPVPIIIAGGKKLPELDALTMAYRALQEGAAGVDMGRNIFQSEKPEAMIKAVRAVVHNNAKPEEAHEIYLDS